MTPTLMGKFLFWLALRQEYTCGVILNQSSISIVELRFQLQIFIYFKLSLDFRKKILNTDNVEIFYTLFLILAMYLLLSSLY